MKFLLTLALGMTFFSNISQAEILMRANQSPKVTSTIPDVKPIAQRIVRNPKTDYDGHAGSSSIFNECNVGYGFDFITNRLNHIGADGKEDPEWTAKKQKWEK